MEIMCGRQPNCGFRAHDRYFEQKKRFAAGICPKCNGPAIVVEDGSDTPVTGVSIVKDRNLGDYGRIIKKGA